MAITLSLVNKINNQIFVYSLGCGIGYGYLHRIPLRMSSESRTITEKSPLLTAEQVPEESSAIPASTANPLELGAAPTIPTLPTSSATTLQVYRFLIILSMVCFKIKLCIGHLRSTFYQQRRFSRSSSNFNGSGRTASANFHRSYNACPGSSQYTRHAQFTPIDDAYLSTGHASDNS